MRMMLKSDFLSARGENKPTQGVPPESAGGIRVNLFTWQACTSTVLPMRKIFSDALQPQVTALLPPMNFAEHKNSGPKLYCSYTIICLVFGSTIRDNIV